MGGHSKGQNITVAFGAGIDRRSVADQTFQHLRAAILSGEIPQGARVIEAQIAKTLDISRAPVREAVNRLLQEGLLESRTHHGPSVIQMTPEKIRWLYDLRAAIEALAIRDVVRQRSKLDLSPLRATVAQMKRFAAKKDLDRLVQTELEFHRTLCHLAGNPYIVQMSNIIDAQVRMALTIDNANYPNLKDVADEHEPIIAAIEAGDAKGAGLFISAHILSSLKAIEAAKAAASQSRPARSSRARA
jgi:DNA-binding GntR family transcriptional regulator